MRRRSAQWPQLGENDAAGMCYTSGTTGHPKGVVYSHRAIFLHSMAVAMADTLAISERDVILHVVPMFHANAWCVPFAGVMVGATQIFAGPHPQPRDIAELVQRERVTFVGAVPTVWIAVKELVGEGGVRPLVGAVHPDRRLGGAPGAHRALREEAGRVAWPTPGG